MVNYNTNCIPFGLVDKCENEESTVMANHLPFEFPFMRATLAFWDEYFISLAEASRRRFEVKLKVNGL